MILFLNCRMTVIVLQRKTSMSIETISSMSHRVSIVPYIVVAKEVFIFFNSEVALRKFSKKYIFSR